MSPFFFFVQLLNAVQYGLILYLVASGLTLLLGIMSVINLAHGAFYMVGAYVAFAVVENVASFWLALPVGILIGFVLAIRYVMARTRIGMMLRAGAENREMARALGVDVNRIYLGVTAVGIACAVLAGVIAAPIASVYPGMGDQILILSFVVVVLGGMGSLDGALVAALLLGLVDAFGKQFFPSYAAFVVYVAMIAVLIVRPQGLFRGTA